MDGVFKALADPCRRELLDRLHRRNGQSLQELCAGLDMTRQSVSKHLAVLEAADLVTVVRRGREKLHYLNRAPINDMHTDTHNMLAMTTGSVTSIVTMVETCISGDHMSTPATTGNEHTK